MHTLYFSIAMVFSMVTTFSSCKGKTTSHNSKTEINQEFKGTKKIKLDPNAIVIFRDKKENLWLMEKKKGVYKYDGKNLILFTASDGLLSYQIISVQEDSKGNLYFDTPEGVFQYNGEKFSILPIMESKNSDAKFGTEWKAGNEDLWFRIGWDTNGPYRFDGENLYHLEFPKNEMEDKFFQKYPNASLNPYAIYTIYKDSKGNTWFGTSNLGIYLFDGKEISWEHEKQWLETPEGGNFGVRSIIEDQDGNYWISNANYKYTLLPNNKKSKGLESINFKRQIGMDTKGIENLYFLSMELDTNGDLLMFANEDGVWRNNGRQLKPFVIKDGEKKIHPTSMYKDNQGIFWFGTKSHGIYTFNGNSFEQFKIK